MTDAKTAFRPSPWFVMVTALFITALLVSNIIAVKLVTIAGHTLFAAIIIFPVSYIFGDILTEVYGYRQARRVIWLGFFCNLVAVLAIWGGGLLPPAPGERQEAVSGAYQLVLGYTPRLLVASFTAYLVGEFSNAAILSRMKLLTRGRWLWTRTIGSTIVGEGLDSAVFGTLALAGVVPGAVLREVILVQWLAKVSYEVLATPLTYAIVAYLKRREGLDAYDRDVSLSPVSLLR
ncbi:MAG: queuosine precursor transporter [Chloroflexi bacterium]|nr:queuosine precursor transporter [Chloroflexota bacterium]